ncbi:hypothetical protein BT67DRAFT_437599 [Trichocladium antarcticum]|uniref:J domain-containing protein n=1 Tax=Trichocladium antarcticum TaxID=1450529 RepID=A0AAN6ZGH9_9PEZI|nr:hypothetical protein BT67DRAFT_437599 [Trichocladium antarcticum]
MSESDMIAYGRDAASRGVDLFALLATDATASEADIRKAFRRKALTAHPDKTGDAYDPALYEGLERARDVLLTPAAREAYDTGMRAVLQKKMQLEQMSSKRRQLVEDLERREEEAKRAKTGTDSPRQLDPVFAAMAARGKAKMAEMKRQREAAEVRERIAKEKEAGPAATNTTSQDPKSHRGTPQNAQPTPPATGDDYDERIADLERRIQEKQLRKAEKKAKKAAAPLVPPSLGRETPHNPPPPPGASGTQADETKSSAAASSAPPAAAPAGDPPKASDRFASTFARLRAAQAKKDEEKRRRAEEEARAANGVPAS